MKPNPSDKRLDGRSDFQHGALSVVSFRQCLDDHTQTSFAANASCVVERCFDAQTVSSSLKVFCEVDGPRPQSTSSLVSSPLSVKVTARENGTPRWWQKQIIEKAIHSALLPALITPPTDWVETCFDLNFVVELPEFQISLEDGKCNLENELSSLQLIANCVTAGSVALMSRGIPMRDFVIGAICCLKMSGSNSRILVDPIAKEVNDASVVVAGTIMPSLGQLTAIWWHTSPKEELRRNAQTSLFQNQSKIVNCLIATAAVLLPVLKEAIGVHS